MKKQVFYALASTFIFIFILIVWAAAHSHIFNESPTASPTPYLSYGYVGYAVVKSNTTIEFHGILNGRNLGQGFSVNVAGVPKGITRETEITDCSTSYDSSGPKCRDIALFLTPTTPGEYNLSNVTITVNSNSRSLTAKLGRVKLEVKSRNESALRVVYYPYAGTYVPTNITHNLTFYYYTVFRNDGNETLLLTGAKADESLLTILGLYYQDVPSNVSPMELDVPNMNKAQDIPKSGLPIKPGDIVAIITPIKVKVPAQNAIVALKFEVKHERTGRLEEIPGILYYILYSGWK